MSFRAGGDLHRPRRLRCDDADRRHRRDRIVGAGPVNRRLGHDVAGRILRDRAQRDRSADDERAGRGADDDVCRASRRLQWIGRRFTTAAADDRCADERQRGHASDDASHPAHAHRPTDSFECAHDCIIPQACRRTPDGSDCPAFRRQAGHRDCSPSRTARSSPSSRTCARRTRSPR